MGKKIHVEKTNPKQHFLEERQIESNELPPYGTILT
jgi:hypothetical protein